MIPSKWSGWVPTHGGHGSFPEKAAQGGHVPKEGPASPRSFAPARKLRAGRDAEGWRVPGPPPFMGRRLGDGNHERSGVWAFFFFFSFLSSQAVFSGALQIAPRLQEREARNARSSRAQRKPGISPRLEAASRPSHRARPSLLGRELALQPGTLQPSRAGQPRCREPGSPAEMAAEALGHHH